MDKFSELKAAAMAATPGPWISGDDSWSDGDHANISTADRYDSGIINIAQVDGGGSESGFDEPFSTEQQANARYITAANPAAILALLAELEAKDKRIAELEDAEQKLCAANVTLDARASVAEAKLATPVRLPRTLWYEHDDLAHEIPVLEKEKVVAEIRAAGFKVEGDE